MTAPFPFTGAVDKVSPAPTIHPMIARTPEKAVASVSVRESKPWSDWFQSLTKAVRQVRVAATLDFGSISAQSRASLTVPFSIESVNVLKESFVTIHCRSTRPSGIIFETDMTADNVITVWAHNYSTGSINPAALEFEFLVTLQG